MHIKQSDTQKDKKKKEKEKSEKWGIQFRKFLGLKPLSSPKATSTDQKLHSNSCSLPAII
jgi:hypothetical protein